jgi:hypothetical protein
MEITLARAVVKLHPIGTGALENTDRNRSADPALDPGIIPVVP